MVNSLYYFRTIGASNVWKRYNTIDEKDSAYVLVLGVTNLPYGMVLSCLIEMEPTRRAYWIYELTLAFHHYKIFKRKVKVPLLNCKVKVCFIISIGCQHK